MKLTQRFFLFSPSHAACWLKNKPTKYYYRTKLYVDLNYVNFGISTIKLTIICYYYYYYHYYHHCNYILATAAVTLVATNRVSLNVLPNVKDTTSSINYSQKYCRSNINIWIQILTQVDTTDDVDMEITISDAKIHMDVIEDTSRATTREPYHLQNKTAIIMTRSHQIINT